MPTTSPFRPLSATLVSGNTGIVMRLSPVLGSKTNADHTAVTMCAAQSSTLHWLARCKRGCGYLREISAARAGHSPLDQATHRAIRARSEEHTSELQSHVNLVC